MIYVLRLKAYVSLNQRCGSQHRKGWIILFGILRMAQPTESTVGDPPEIARYPSRAGLFLSSALRERENPLSPLIRGDGRVYFSRMRRGQWRASARVSSRNKSYNRRPRRRRMSAALEKREEEKEVRKDTREEEREREGFNLSRRSLARSPPPPR